MDIVTAVWLSLVAGAFVAGFFVGGKHKERTMKAMRILKNTAGKL
ncbi:MAG: hypothetical protein M0Z38_06675 [Deltaproteobacteria bacterium]|nr:hypothetical protein [Deltaproteobacteria bacterium]